MAQTPPSSASGSAGTSHSRVEQYLAVYRREHATTEKVLRAFPCLR